MGKAKNIVFLIAKIVMGVLTLVYAIYTLILEIGLIVDYSGGNGWSALAFILIWTYLLIPACALFIISLVFLILAICFKNYKRKLLNIIVFAILTAIPVILQVGGIVVMSALGNG